MEKRMRLSQEAVMEERSEGQEIVQVCLRVVGSWCGGFQDGEGEIEASAGAGTRTRTTRREARGAQSAGKPAWRRPAPCNRGRTCNCPARTTALPASSQSDRRFARTQWQAPGRILPDRPSHCGPIRRGSPGRLVPEFSSQCSPHFFATIDLDRGVWWFLLSP